MTPHDADIYHVQTVVWTGEAAEICRAVGPDGKVVALKRLRRDIKGRRAAMRAIEHEGEMALLFDHPNIVKAYHFIPLPVPTLVMEYFPSRNLKVRILEPRGDYLLTYHTRPILLSMADSLAHVHDRNIIHMDIKPENYLLSEDGVLKLTDFAIASRPVTDWRRFIPGRRRIAGTRPYIAPETLRRRQPDHRTDIYSFGATLYEILTGRPPFISNDRDELLKMHLRQTPAYLTGYNKNLTDDINALVLLMLEKDPDRRPQSMAEVKARLEAIDLYLEEPKEVKSQEATR